jgi:APA family basic amino acid/polyamine antiporter
MPKQQLGLGGAVAIGLASMLGAGVFVVFSTAYTYASDLIFVAIGLAALVAGLNSWAIYQLAKQVDRPGGVYAYSRTYLNPHVSFLSGFAFVFGKIASIAAIALVFQKYVFPDQPFWSSVLAIAILALINILGINRTAGVATFLSLVTIIFFLTVISWAFLSPATPSQTIVDYVNPRPIEPLIMAAGVVFFAFAGYARVATLGNEVRDAKRNIPKAIVISLSAVLVIYLALALVLMLNLGGTLMDTQTPVALLTETITGNVWITPIVAAVASLGSMLALLAGVSRTAATMAEDQELPKGFHRRNRFGSPWLAEVIIATGAICLTAVGEIVWVIGFSSFSVLFYYAIGHLSALAQPREQRVMPKWLNWLGIFLCLTLAVSFGFETLTISFGILALAFLARWLWHRGQSL